MSGNGKHDHYVFDLTVFDKETYTAILKVKKFKISDLDDTVLAVKAKIGEEN